MGRQTTTRTKRIVEKSSADTKFLEKTIAAQVELLTTCGTVFGAMYDTLVDAEHLLEEENVDDIFSVGTLKDDVGEMIKKVNEWKEKQNDELT